MNIYQLRAPEHATHYRILTTGQVVYYHIDGAIFKYQDDTWIEIDEPVNFEGELREL